MDKTKKTTGKAATGATAKKKPPAKKTKKTATTEKGEVKSAQAAAPKAAKKAGNEKAKEKKAKKKEDVQIMTLEMIEEKFEKQTKAYNQRIMKFMKAEQRPLTLALICKYAFPKPRYSKQVLDAMSE